MIPAGKTWAQEELRSSRHVGDPVADSAVEALFADCGEEYGRQLLTALIRHGHIPTDCPSVIGDYLSTTAELPQWLDRRLVARAERVFENHGWATFGLLGCSSLPQGYAVRDIAMVLGTTATISPIRSHWAFVTYLWCLRPILPEPRAARSSGDCARSFRRSRRVRIEGTVYRLGYSLEGRVGSEWMHSSSKWSAS
jgi:hypothetical protein